MIPVGDAIIGPAAIVIVVVVAIAGAVYAAIRSRSAVSSAIGFGQGAAISTALVVLCTMLLSAGTPVDAPPDETYSVDPAASGYRTGDVIAFSVRGEGGEEMVAHCLARRTTTEVVDGGQSRLVVRSQRVQDRNPPLISVPSVISWCTVQTPEPSQFDWVKG